MASSKEKGVMVLTPQQQRIKERVEYIAKHSDLTVQQLADNLGITYQTTLAMCYRHNLKFQHVKAVKRTYTKLKRNFFNVDAYQDWLVGVKIR